MYTFQFQWKQSARSKLITSYDMALLAFVKALNKDKPLEQASYYLSKSFKPITNKRKLANGAHPYFGMWDAIRNCKHSLLAKFLDEETISKIDVLASNIAPSYMKVNFYGQD